MEAGSPGSPFTFHPPPLQGPFAGMDDFGPRMGGTLSTHSTHSTLATGASISTLHGFKNTLNSVSGNWEQFGLIAKCFLLTHQTWVRIRIHTSSHFAYCYGGTPQALAAE